MKGVWLGAAVASLLLCAALVYGQGPSEANGDGCGSGQVFPVEHDGATLVGCSKFQGKNWCRREDGSFIACPDLLLLASAQSSGSNSAESPLRTLVSTPGKKVIITEVLVINDLFVDEDGETSDWLELHNGETETVDLEGWSLTDSLEQPRKWIFPSIKVSPDQYIIVFASGKDRVSEESAHTNFRMKSDGEYLALVRPDGSVASALASEYPRQIPNVPYGIPNYPAGAAQFTLLNEPTPGAPNAGPLESGPFISDVVLKSSKGAPPAGKDLVIEAIVSQHLASIASVELVYAVMYEGEATIPMTKSHSKGYIGRIPASSFAAGIMVRWYVKTVDSDGNVARDPPYVTEDWPQYYGTVIADPALESTLPTMHWFTSNPKEATSVEGFRGSLFYRGKFYDNVFTRRRGVTSLTWPKPKLKFDFKGRVFKYDQKLSVEEFNLQSFFDEPGEDSYMRETAAYAVMEEAGVPASESFHTRLNMNGKFYGLFAFVEQVDDGFLERHRLSVQGPLFKAVHGELSNLRWDVKRQDLQFAYRKGNRKELDEWGILHELVQGLGGGGSLPRSKFLYNYLNLPEIINYMAVSNMLLNQDRCTKNFYLYRNPADMRWSIFPWDLEGSFGISSGLGGKPAPDYCVLVCEQWNSPLYCDSGHPQDIAALTNLALQTGRKLQQTTPNLPNTYRIPDPEAYDRDRTVRPSPTGAAGTFSHLEDAILDWAETREMYLRRLRTLVDYFMNGKIQDILKDIWKSIRSDALKDNAKWSVTVDPDKGLEQLLTEQIPKRRALLLETYGPEGYGLLPAPQPSKPQLEILVASNDYVQVVNNNSFAVDMSNWVLSGDVTYRFPPGCVVASGSSVFVTPNVSAFLARTTSPKGGEGLFVVGPSSPISGGAITLVTDSGIPV